MKKKIISILVIIGIIIGVICSASTQAGTGKLYTSLAALNPDGVGYGIADPTNKGSYIWHMSTFNSTSGGLSEEQKSIYCLKAGYGASWESFNNTSPILEYNLVFDLQKDRENLSSKIVDNENDADEVVQAILNENGTQYKQILWLLDNMYIEGETDKEEFLSRVGIEKDVYEGVAEYYNSKTNKIYGDEVLTPADIIAIQRVAIWTFTNGGDYDKTEDTHWLRITSDATNYNILGDSREAMAVDLYKYLVSSAKTGASLYTADNNYTISEVPLGLNLDNLEQIDGKYQIVSEIANSNYLIGPIKLEQNNDMTYEVSMTVKDINGTVIESSNYNFTDSNGITLGDVTLKDLVGRTEGFYINIDNSYGTEFNVEIKIGYYNTVKNLWLQGTESTSQVLLNAEQPLVEFAREIATTTVDFIAELPVVETTDISVEKVWDDRDNQDGIRPDSITVKLLADGTDVEGKTLELNDENQWKGVFSELPVYSGSTRINYTVEETTVLEGYEQPAITGTAETGFVITNKHIPEVMNIPVTKKWEDNNNQDGIRPEAIYIYLKANNKEIQTLELNEENNWSGVFSNLPVYSNGDIIQYTPYENVNEGYRSKFTSDGGTGYIITNQHTTSAIQISVEKIWEDNNNQDGIRPDSVTVRLLANGTEVEGQQIELSETNNWKYTFTQLPEYSNGIKIQYSISELTLTEGYTTEISGDVENGFIITNTHVPETTQIEVEKIWDDGENQDDIRPDSVEIILYADGVEKERKDVTGTEDIWTAKFTNLPVNKDGKQIKYTIDEVEVQGYEKTINGFKITNKHIPGTTRLKVIKQWNDSDNKDGLRTESVTISLLKNEEKYKTIELNESNNWQYTFTELPIKENGEDVKYSVSEITQIDGYTTNIEEKQTTTEIQYTITNTHEVKKEFDLALRKYITEINGEKLFKTRVPNIDKTTLETYTTATYKHQKNPVEVKTGDVVTYSITIYNEGEKEGYATQIIDQLSEGLKYVSGKTVNSNKNTYKVTYNESTNQVKFDLIETTDKEIQELQPYTNEKLDSETIEIQCEVTAIASKEKDTILTNVAWISQDSNKEEEKDRDSNTERYPNVDKENIQDYTGNEKNKEDLTDDQYHYLGEQDDDDFEKLIISEEEKNFDLALRKYIIKINNNEISTLGLPTRVPNILLDTLKNGTTATYNHPKEPVEVEENDIITYAITIYNEGESAGYATQVIDQLPTGLIYNPSTTIISKNSNGEDKNKYKVTYEASTNKVIFDIINTEEEPAKEIQPYKNGKLDSETIEIKCKVIYRAKAGKNSILTNVAWINEAFDADGNKLITTTIGDDRDSEPGTKPNVNKDNMLDYKGEQDDDDFEKVYVKALDLNLRLFIDSISGVKPEISREPVVDVTPLIKGTSTTAIYNHPKTPIGLKAGDIVIYTIRIYNEGETDGYASEVKNYLAPYLEFIENSELNKKYGWKISEDGRLATTEYLANKVIKAFDGKELDYRDLQIECKVSEDAVANQKLTDIAEISQYKYGGLIYPEDIDSESYNIDINMPEDEKLPNYKEEQELDKYVPGYEDDDDFEKVYVKEYDLALRKFITQIKDKEITTRIPQVKIENGKISYEHPKDVLTAHVGEVVIYTLRIYNEGRIAGYASEITDDIPEYLEFLPEDSTNVEYMWKMYDESGKETEKVEEAVKVKTNYLSKENGEHNIINAFDGETVSYKDIKISFRIKDPKSNTQIITNKAQISNDTDENGREMKDNDSITNQWNDGEDDQDAESLKVQYFDLSILKFVSKVIVIEDGKETITETGYNGHENPEPVVKVELHKKKLKNVIVKFGYGITVTNEGDVPGYATEIKDYVPDGLKFVATDNPNWTDEGNNVISTKQLEKTLLKPGESKTIEVILTWINSPDNMAQKTNTVEISDDKNEYDVPDRDSIINNKQDGEDDIDVAKVILAISTGRTQTYFTLTLGLLAFVLVGVILIKKFVI